MRQAFERLYGHRSSRAAWRWSSSAAAAFGPTARATLIPVQRPDMDRGGRPPRRLSASRRRWAKSAIRRRRASRSRCIDRFPEAPTRTSAALPSSFSAGLAPVIAPNGTLVMYSAAFQFGHVEQWRRPPACSFRNCSRKSAFPDLMAEETLNRTRVERHPRFRAAGWVPWISSSLAEDFSFIPGARPTQPRFPNSLPPATPPPPPASPAAPRLDPPAPPKAEERQRSRRYPRSRWPALQSRWPARRTMTPPLPPAQPALADDPTIKSLAVRAPREPRRQPPRSTGAAGSTPARAPTTACDQGFRRHHPPQAREDVEAYNNRCWARAVTGGLQPALGDCDEALRLATRTSSTRSKQPRARQPRRAGRPKNAGRRFRRRPRDQSAADIARCTDAALARQRSGADFGRRESTSATRERDGPEYWRRNLPATGCAENVCYQSVRARRFRRCGTATDSNLRERVRKGRTGNVEDFGVNDFGKAYF